VLQVYRHASSSSAILAILNIGGHSLGRLGRDELGQVDIDIVPHCDHGEGGGQEYRDHDPHDELDAAGRSTRRKTAAGTTWPTKPHTQRNRNTPVEPKAPLIMTRRAIVELDRTCARLDNTISDNCKEFTCISSHSMTWLGPMVCPA
jgi:hypothetical protein